MSRGAGDPAFNPWSKTLTPQLTFALPLTAPAVWLVFPVFLSIAQFERERIFERSREGLAFARNPWGVPKRSISVKNSAYQVWCRRCGRIACPAFVAGWFGAGFDPLRLHTGTSFTRRLRFWAVAARRNSSLAPDNPRSRRRVSFCHRLRWANSISIFLRRMRAI